MVLTPDGLYVGYGSPVLAPERLQGHVFRFDFTAEDGSLYASASVLYPLPPGATIAPDLPPAAPTAPPIPAGTLMRGTVTVDPIVPGIARVGVLLVGRPGDVVSYSIYRDGLPVSPTSPGRVLTSAGMHVTYDGTQAPYPIAGHVYRFDFTADDGSLYASASLLYPLPGTTTAPPPSPTATTLPTPRPTTGTTSPAIHIDSMTPTSASISFTAPPNSRVSCTYLQDGKPVYFETGGQLVGSTGIGRCDVRAGSGVPTLTSVYVIIVFLQDGSELGRATLSYPLP